MTSTLRTFTVVVLLAVLTALALLTLNTSANVADEARSGPPKCCV